MARYPGASFTFRDGPHSIYGVLISLNKPLLSFKQTSTARKDLSPHPSFSFSLSPSCNGFTVNLQGTLAVGSGFGFFPIHPTSPKLGCSCFWYVWSVLISIHAQVTTEVHHLANKQNYQIFTGVKSLVLSILLTHQLPNTSSSITISKKNKGAPYSSILEIVDSA